MSVMRWVALFAAFVLAQPVLTAGAQQKDEDTVTIYGLGTAPCRTWTEARESARTSQTDSRQAQFESWIYGYASAYSIFGRGSHDVLRTDTAGFRTFLDGYCRDNPSDIFQTAVTELIKDQLKR